MENEEWEMECGEWRMKNGEQRMGCGNGIDSEKCKHLNNHKTLSRLKLNSKRRLIVVDVRFVNKLGHILSRDAFIPKARAKYLMDLTKLYPSLKT